MNHEAHEQPGQHEGQDAPSSAGAAQHPREPLPPSVFERNALNIQRAVLAVCALLVVGDVVFTFVGHRHAHFSFEEYPGVYGAIGFASYVGLVLSAKVLRKLVMRPESYYDRPEDDA